MVDVVPTEGPDAAPSAPERGRRRLAGYALLTPGTLWLALFFLVPIVTLVATSLYDPAGSLEFGYKMTGHVQNYPDAIADYWPHIRRSLLYALIATAACVVLGYPLAYAIAFKAGRFKTILLVAVIAPFFTSFLVRTLAWQYLLGDNEWVVSFLRWLPFTGSDLQLMNTSTAVVAGLVYNFLPFFVLPLYASLEKIDHRLLEAAGDLYASPAKGFLKVTLPLSMPGVVAGTLLTFIPAAGDYINDQLLGSPNTRMVGNAIQELYFAGNYPSFAALSVTLMVVVVVMVAVYVWRAGTEDLV